MKRKAVILGGGAAGLITAWKLLDSGWDVDIYEKSDLTGGMCRTWKWRDFLVDTGPHIYHTPDKELARLWEAEFGDLFVKDEFWCKNVKGEDFAEYWDYPLSWESISKYPKALKEKVLGELGRLSFEDKARARNYKEYINSQVGPTLREMFFEKYPEKIWGIPTSEMCPGWAPKRIEFRQKVTPFYHNQWNAAGKYGTGCIFDRIKEKVAGLGGKIFHGYEVTGLEHKESLISAVLFRDARKLQIDSGDVVISTLPVTVLAGFLGYSSKLEFRGIRSVYLAYDKENILPEGVHWLYYDSEKVYFNRVTEAKKISPYMAPEDKTYITCEITFSKGDEIDLMDPETLARKVSGQVERAGLAESKEVTAWDTNKEYYVYPFQYRGYQEELSRTRAVISGYRHLYSLGTGGDFYYADAQVIFHKAFDLADVLCGKDTRSTQVIKQIPRCKLNRTVSINGKKIGEGNRAYVIAEAGLNHNGSMDLAKKLIDAAGETGCDAVKFQTFKASSRISTAVKAVRYAETIIGTEETMYEMFDRLSLTPEQHKELFRYAGEKGIEIFSTPFDEESVDMLESLGVSAYKIASMDLVNLKLLEYTARKGKPVILSTGMASLGQIEEAVQVFEDAGNPDVILLHCNSSYPAAPQEMNLEAIRTLKKCFGTPVGLSDHTMGLFVAHTALAIGADIIERHFTLDRTLEGPDHILSSEPDELRKLVEMAKLIPAVIGDGVKRIQPNEYDMLNTQRKSLYAACDIKKGDVITDEMISVKGPGGGLLPRYFDIVVGRIARADILRDYPITWEVI
ncbi:MAG: N-acetylneuraminate synthase family protein [Candidatus Omnitrophota bacterium]